MKNLATLLFSFLLIGMTVNATPTKDTTLSNLEINSRYDGNAYIFTEGTVEFSVFPDGQFDFVFVGAQNGTQVSISSPNGQVSFNTGRDHEAYVQYDDYGAVVQVEEVAVYYDEFGRIVQAGNVDIQYNERRLVRVGGLNVHYNNFGRFGYTTGFINNYNRGYFFQPWHAFYVRPIFASCIVWDTPYRRFYSPFRYNYYTHVNYYNNRYNVAYINGRRNFYNPGSRLHYKNGRTVANRNYRADRRNTMVTRHGRNNGYARANVRGTNTRTTTTARATNSRVAKRTNNTTARNTRGTVRTTRDTKAVARTTRGNTNARNTNTSKTRGTTANRTSRSIAKNSNSSARKSNTTSRSRNSARTSAPSKKRSTARTSRPSSSRKATTARKSTSRSSSASRSGSKRTSRSTPKRGRGL